MDLYIHFNNIQLFPQYFYFSIDKAYHYFKSWLDVKQSEQILIFITQVIRCLEILISTNKPIETKKHQLNELQFQRNLLSIFLNPLLHMFSTISDKISLLLVVITA